MCYLLRFPSSKTNRVIISKVKGIMLRDLLNALIHYIYSDIYSIKMQGKHRNWFQLESNISVVHMLNAAKASTPWAVVVQKELWQIFIFQSPLNLPRISMPYWFIIQCIKISSFLPTVIHYEDNLFCHWKVCLVEKFGVLTFRKL